VDYHLEGGEDETYILPPISSGDDVVQWERTIILDHFDGLVNRKTPMQECTNYSLCMWTGLDINKVVHVRVDIPGKSSIESVSDKVLGINEVLLWGSMPHFDCWNPCASVHNVSGQISGISHSGAYGFRIWVAEQCYSSDAQGLPGWGTPLQRANCSMLALGPCSLGGYLTYTSAGLESTLSFGDSCSLRIYYARGQPSILRLNEAGVNRNSFGNAISFQGGYFLLLFAGCALFFKDKAREVLSEKYKAPTLDGNGVTAFLVRSSVSWVPFVSTFPDGLQVYFVLTLMSVTLCSVIFVVRKSNEHRPRRMAVLGITAIGTLLAAIDAPTEGISTQTFCIALLPALLTEFIQTVHPGCRTPGQCLELLNVIDDALIAILTVYMSGVRGGGPCNVCDQGFYGGVGNSTAFRNGVPAQEYFVTTQGDGCTQCGVIVKTAMALQGIGLSAIYQDTSHELPCPVTQGYSYDGWTYPAAFLFAFLMGFSGLMVYFMVVADEESSIRAVLSYALSFPFRFLQIFVYILAVSGLEDCEPAWLRYAALTPCLVTSLLSKKMKYQAEVDWLWDSDKDTSKTAPSVRTSVLTPMYSRRLCRPQGADACFHVSCLLDSAPEGPCAPRVSSVLGWLRGQSAEGPPYDTTRGN